MDDDLKRSVMVDCRLWDDDDDDDDGSVDSTMTPRSPFYYEISKAAAKTWNQMDDETKMAWKQRTIQLNSRPPTDGVFRTIPEAINTGICENVLTSLTQDWSNLVRIMKHLMMSKRFTLAKESKRVFKFGKETVRKQNQVYKSLYINFLLKSTIFGSNFTNLHPSELQYQTKNQAILHILSNRRMKELFTFGGMNASTLKKDGCEFICCAKANLKTRNDKNVIGYVIDEEGEDLKIRIMNVDEEDDITVTRPMFDALNGTYIYSENQRGHYSLTELWPVRLKLNSSGQSYLLMSVAMSSCDD